MTFIILTISILLLIHSDMLIALGEFLLIHLFIIVFSVFCKLIKNLYVQLK